MLKSIGILQLAVAPLLVLPAMTGQEQKDGGIEAQLSATLQSIDYLRGVEVSVRTGDAAALRALERSTEPARDASPQRAAHLEALQDDIARLRFSLDQLLNNPAEVEAILSMPPAVVRALGLGGKAPDETITITTPAPGAPAPDGTIPPPFGVAENGQITTSPALESLPDRTAVAITDPAAARPEVVAGVDTTAGLTEAARSAIRGVPGPFDSVRESSRRRGSEPVALEQPDYVADPVALGRLLVRSKRPAEAVDLLELHRDDPGGRYWLGRAYQDLDRSIEALDIYRDLASDEDAGFYQRHAQQDLEFLEFREALRKRRR